MKNKYILNAFEEINFSITSSSKEMERYQKAYNFVKEYFNNNISFDELMEKVEGICPPNKCYWCDSCADCDIDRIYQKGVDENAKCRACWKKCLRFKEKDQNDVCIEKLDKILEDLSEEELFKVTIKMLKNLFNNIE